MLAVIVSDRFTGARNPARLPTTIQSRRIRCAPTWLRLAGTTTPFYHRGAGRAFIIEVCVIGIAFFRTLVVSLVLLAGLAASALAAPMTKINIVLKNQAGKPVDHASVVVRFVQGHSVVKLGKAIRTTFELRSNQEGEARIPSIPQGKILVQVIAKGYQTFGQTFEVTEEEKTLEITLNPPQQQYTAH